jgi:2-haloacid dehalogenase
VRSIRPHSTRRSRGPAHCPRARAPTPPCGPSATTAPARLAVLTNSGAEGGRRTLEHLDLAGHFEAILGVDPVRSVKPHPSTYRHALEALGAEPEAVTLAAAHDWDITGAKRAGLRTAYVQHGQQSFSPAAEPPDVQASDLEDLAARLTRSAR